MLEVYTSVIKGIIYLRLEGELTDKTFSLFEEVINYLLYKQRMKYYVIDFDNIKIEKGMISLIQNKLVEINLSCGKANLCGINYDSKYTFNNFMDAIKYFYI